MKRCRWWKWSICFKRGGCGVCRWCGTFPGGRGEPGQLHSLCADDVRPDCGASWHCAGGCQASEAQQAVELDVCVSQAAGDCTQASPAARTIVLECADSVGSRAAVRFIAARTSKLAAAPIAVFLRGDA